MAADTEGWMMTQAAGKGTRTESDDFREQKSKNRIPK